MKKLVPIVLSCIFLFGCSVSNQETEIIVFQNTVNATYSGRVKQKVPNGEGIALMEKDAKVEGTFEKGVFLSGNATNVSYQITYNNQSIDGLYSGTVENQLPTGNGTFQSDEFSYEGIWHDGNPDGTGTLVAKSFQIDTPNEAFIGNYEGEVNQYLAQGSGTFIYEKENEKIEIKGNFRDNMFDGLLMQTIHYPDTVKSYPVYYQKGWQLQNATSLIAYLEGMRNESYALSEAQSAFISQYDNLFEGKGKEKDFVDNYNQSFRFASFSNTDEPSFILIRNAQVMSIQRYKPYEDANTVTSMIVQNHEGWYHLVFAYSVEHCNQGETVDIYALPLCNTTLTAPEQDYPAIDAAGALVINHHIVED